MVSVAKNFDAPIKLLFPRALDALGERARPPAPATAVVAIWRGGPGCIGGICGAALLPRLRFLLAGKLRSPHALPTA